MKALFTTKEVAKALNISKATLDKYAMAGADKNHPLYLQFSGGNGALRRYPRYIVKAKLIELGASEQDAEQMLQEIESANA